MKRFDLRLLLAALVLAVIVFLVSLWLFPEWRLDARMLVVLAAAALVGVFDLLANARAWTERHPAPPVDAGDTNTPQTEIHATTMVGGSAQAGRDFIGGDQIVHNYPAPERVQGVPRTVPPPPADFLGRADDLDTLQSAYGGGRRVFALCGQGGAGKSALSFALAQRWAEHYPDGQVLIALRGMQEDSPGALDALAQVVLAFARETRLPESLSEAQALYRQTLAGKRALLVLDDAKDEQQVAHLLPPPPGCAVIVTSRARLALDGGFPHEVEALQPRPAADLIRAIAPHVDVEDAAALAKTCDYLPLALRPVAALLAKQRSMPTGQLLKEMQDEQRRLALTGIDAALWLSYRALTEPQQADWRRLAVFAGWFDAPAAAAVWGAGAQGGLEAGEVAQGRLAELEALHLLDFDPERERYTLHGLARAYAAERMTAEEAQAARQRHGEHYRPLLALADGLYMLGGADMLRGLALFDREWTEIEAGQRWAAAQPGAEASQYTDAGAYSLYLRLHPRDCIRWLEDALAATRRAGDRQMEGNHLGNLGTAYRELGEPRRAIETYEQALAIAREIGDRRNEGAWLGNLGTAYWSLGEPRRAIEYYEQALAIAREIGDRRGEGAHLGNLGIAYRELGEPRRAIETYEQALAIAREIGDRRGEGNRLGNLGNAYGDLGESRRAIEFYEQALAIDRETGDRRGEGADLGNLGNAYRELGEPRRAIETYEQALAIAREIGDRHNEAIHSWNLGLLYRDQGELERALALMQVCVEYEREIGHPDAEQDAAEVEEARRRLAG